MMEPKNSPEKGAQDLAPGVQGPPAQEKGQPPAVAQEKSQPSATAQEKGQPPATAQEKGQQPAAAPGEGGTARARVVNEYRLGPQPGAVPAPGGYTPVPSRATTPAYRQLVARAADSRGAALTLLCLLFGAVVCETVLLGAAGLSVPLCVLGLCGLEYLCFYQQGRRLPRAAVVLWLPVALLSLSFFLHYNPSTQWIVGLTLCALLAAQLVLLGGAPVRGVYSPSMVLQAARYLLIRPFQNLGVPVKALGALRQTKSRTVRSLLSVLIGLGIALPVGAVLLALFSLADEVYGRAVDNVVRALGINPARLVWDVLLGAFLGLLLAGCLLGLRWEEKGEAPPGGLRLRVNALVSGVFLGVIDLLAASFVGFQFVYLFGGRESLYTFSLTYAEYARRGFFELCAASAILFFSGLAVLLLTRERGDAPPLAVRLLVLALCACDLVLLCSAAKRMAMYVDFRGLSIRRLLTLWAMAVILVCLLIMAARCLVPRLNVLGCMGAAAVAGVCVLGLVNTERAVARYNVDRALADPGVQLDLQYLNELSYTAAPEIARIGGLDLTAYKESSSGDFYWELYETWPGEGDNGEDEVKRMLEKKAGQLRRRHPLYGFALDALPARRVLGLDAFNRPPADTAP